MAHQIENEQIAWANQVPWHGLGALKDGKPVPFPHWSDR